MVGLVWGCLEVLVPHLPKQGPSPVLQVPPLSPSFKSAFGGLRCPLLTTEGRTVGGVRGEHGAEGGVCVSLHKLHIPPCVLASALCTHRETSGRLRGRWARLQKGCSCWEAGPAWPSPKAGASLLTPEPTGPAGSL